MNIKEMKEMLQLMAEHNLTEIEIEKVAIAMNIPPSQLRQQAGSLSTGDFIYNDAVRNTNRKIHARWLLTYHAGPLQWAR